MDVLRYIQENEQTANVKLCHVYQGDGQIPSELEANHRIVDEAYPAITVDLVGGLVWIAQKAMLSTAPDSDKRHFHTEVGSSTFGAVESTNFQRVHIVSW